MRVLVTGITGFVGSHFAEHALACGAEVFGSYRWRSKTENIEHIRSRIELVECDLRDMSSAHHLIEVSRPDLVIHLAAQSFVGASWQAPAETFMTNTVSQVNLLEAIRAQGAKPRILVIGSSEEYGFVHEDELPITETNPLRPLSPYAVSKVTQDKLAYQYFKSFGLHLVVTRGFNHTGPRRGLIFVTSSFARQIAEIEAGQKDAVLHVGDLTSKRDWTDVRDMVRAYWVALEKAEPGEAYNIGSGRTWSVREMLDILLSHSTARVVIQEDPERLRPSDVPILWADTGKFRQATGWEPRIPFETTMLDLLDYWRARVRIESAHVGVGEPSRA